jgi:hypothetical protein
VPERMTFIRQLNNTKRKHGDIDYGSDDGSSDMRYHVVGLGQKEFDKVMRNPKLLAGRYRKGAYRECFGYCFHEPELPRTEQDKQATLEELTIKSRYVIKLSAELEYIAGKLTEQTNKLTQLLSLVQSDRKNA